MVNFFFTVETPIIVNYFNNSSKMASLVYESENCGSDGSRKGDFNLNQLLLILIYDLGYQIV